MASTQPDYAWLPDHQQHVVFTLAHVDDLINRAGTILMNYLRHGPLELANVADGESAHVVVTRVAPLPPAVSRLTADALTQLRAAIEHTLFAEVEYQIGRRLDEAEGRRIEMPACNKPDAFDDWLRQRRRAELAPLVDGTALVARLRDLQPYNRQDVDNHPLRVLAEHTNLAKHRTPAVAATFVGTVIPDVADPDLIIGTSSGKPVSAGDRLVTGPVYKRVPLSIWPMVSIQRPHTGDWYVLLKELSQLEDWVRTVAIPILIAGTHMVPPLPPHIDTSTGWPDFRVALTSAGHMPAAMRTERTILAAIAREGMVEVLALHQDSPPIREIKAWADGLDDDQVLKRQGELARHRDDLRRLEQVVHTLLDEIRRAQRVPQPSAATDQTELPPIRLEDTS